jgi:hypothetical protein
MEIPDFWTHASMASFTPCVTVSLEKLKKIHDGIPKKDALEAEWIEYFTQMEACFMAFATTALAVVDMVEITSVDVSIIPATRKVAETGMVRVVELMQEMRELGAVHAGALEVLMPACAALVPLARWVDAKAPVCRSAVSEVMLLSKQLVSSDASRADLATQACEAISALSHVAAVQQKPAEAVVRMLRAQSDHEVVAKAACTALAVLARTRHHLSKGCVVRGNFAIVVKPVVSVPLDADVGLALREVLVRWADHSHVLVMACIAMSPLIKSSGKDANFEAEETVKLVDACMMRFPDNDELHYGGLKVLCALAAQLEAQKAAPPAWLPHLVRAAAAAMVRMPSDLNIQKVGARALAHVARFLQGQPELLYMLMDEFGVSALMGALNTFFYPRNVKNATPQKVDLVAKLTCYACTVLLHTCTLGSVEQRQEAADAVHRIMIEWPATFTQVGAHALAVHSKLGSQSGGSSGASGAAAGAAGVSATKLKLRTALAKKAAQRVGCCA